MAVDIKVFTVRAHGAGLVFRVVREQRHDAFVRRVVCSVWVHGAGGAWAR